jgi:hypothetical protein
MDVVERFERIMAKMANDMPLACFIDPEHLNTWIFRISYDDIDMDISIFLDRDNKAVLFSIFGIRGSVAMDLVDSPDKLFGEYTSYFRSERTLSSVMDILNSSLFPIFDEYIYPLILQIK